MSLKHALAIGHFAIYALAFPATQAASQAVKYQVVDYSANSAADSGMSQADIGRYIKNAGSSSFLEAIQKNYANRSFNEESQRYDDVVSGARSWGGLDHAPVRARVLAPEAYIPYYLSKPATNHYYQNAAFHTYVDGISRSTLTFGNSLQLLEDSAAYREKMRFIREAKEGLYIASLWFLCHNKEDGPTAKMIDALLARRGSLTLYVAVDGLNGKKCASRLQEKGINFIQVDYRDRKWGRGIGVMHHKIWVKDPFSDNAEAIQGGENLDDEEALSDGFNFQNRDTDMLVRGPAVTDLMDGYIRMWNFAAQRQKVFQMPVTLENRMAKHRATEKVQRLRPPGYPSYDTEFYRAKFADPATRDAGVCRTIVQNIRDNNEKDQDATQALNAYIAYARKSLYFSTPGIDFQKLRESSDHDQTFVQIAGRAQAGVNVDIVTNAAYHRVEAGDSTAGSGILSSRESSWKANRKSLQALAQAGGEENLHGWSYFNYMHGKSGYFDQTVMLVGSYNLSRRASKFNHETTMFCQDASMRRSFEDRVILDLVNSVPVR